MTIPRPLGEKDLPKKISTLKALVEFKDTCLLACRHNRPTQTWLLYKKRPTTAGDAFHRRQVPQCGGH
jgi:hypothetical protein